MAKFTLTAGRVPFRVTADSREEAAKGLAEALDNDPTLFEKRIAKLEKLGAFSEKDIDFFRGGRGNVGETDSGLERALVGAGREITSSARGVQQLFNQATGDTEKVSELQQREANERETFAALDEQGIGLEDLGQLVPNVAAFIGTGGSSTFAQAVQLAARGAALGASRATVEGESRAKNAAFEAALSAAGPVALRTGGTIVGGITNATKPLAKLAGQLGIDAATGGMATILRVGGNTLNLFTKSKRPGLDKVAVEAGERALSVTRDIVTKLNAQGKQGVVAEATTDALTGSIRTISGQRVLDVPKFLDSLEGFADPQLRTQLGKTFGNQLAGVRDTLRQILKENPKMSLEQVASISNRFGTVKDAGMVLSAIGASVRGKAKDNVITRFVNRLQAAESGEEQDALGQGQ